MKLGRRGFIGSMIIQLTRKSAAEGRLSRGIDVVALRDAPAAAPLSTTPEHF
jgi:hypothetical protein